MPSSNQKAEGGGTAIGAAIGGMFGGGQGAAAGGQIGGAIGGLFGSDGRTRAKWNLRTAYKYATRYQPEYDKAMFDAKMASFEKHGIHPLFGLGGSTGGGGPAFSMPGQAPSGSHATEALGNVLQYLVRKEEVELQRDYLDKQAQDSAMRVIDNKMGNDNLINLADQVKSQYKVDQVDKVHQEHELGKVQSHHKDDPSKNTNVKSAWTKTYFIPGSKKFLYLPAEEPSEVFDSAALAWMTYMHPHNKPIIDAWLKQNAPNLSKALNPSETFREFMRRINAGSGKQQGATKKWLSNILKKSRAQRDKLPTYKNFSRDFPG
ncbi:hypothetical protein [Eel River basin pequenovirus]|nr:hypothetical protein [Eel River basin pequenovirus]